MTKDEARKLLEDGKFLYYDVWWYSKLTMSCHMGCCDNHSKKVLSNLLRKNIEMF